MSELEVEEILSPKKEWVDDSCYRINRRQKNIRKIVQQSLAAAQGPYTDNEGIYILLIVEIAPKTNFIIIIELLQCDDICDYEIEFTENGRYKTSIRLPQ